jgi:hypothetical protein
VVFDLIEGVSSDHSGRTFDSDVSYDIYIRVESDDAELNTDGDGPGTWGTWSGGGNLGSDDRIILVGDGDAVEGPGGGTVQSFIPAFGGALWSTSGVNSAAFLQANGAFSRTTESFDTAVLWTGTWGSSPNAGSSINEVYLITMPVNMLTSQGLA